MLIPYTVKVNPLGVITVRKDSLASLGLILRPLLN
jgi:hypothetical protein